jgi:hypothetical protein
MTRVSEVSISLVAAVLAYSAQFAPGQAQCKPGFVMREAYAGDQVCVTPETRAQAMEDNRLAASRRPAPNKDSCVQGYVWRQAIPQDHVCVTMAVRSQTQQDNQLAATRVVLPGMGAYGATSGGGMGKVETQPMQSGGQAVMQTGSRAEMVVPHPAQNRMRPRPAALSDMEITTAAHKVGVVGRLRLPGVYTPDVRYQLESYSNTFGAEVNTTAVSDAVFYGANGYVEIDFNAQPGKQYLLDCSVGEDGTYKVGTTFVDAHGNGPNYSGGPMTSFNRHLLIPLNPAPGNAATAKVVVSFTEIEFYGCKVETVQ